MGITRVGRVGDAVEEAPLVEAPIGPAFAARAVVGDDDHDGVVDLARILEIVKDSAHPVVVVGDYPAKTSAMLVKSRFSSAFESSQGRTVSSKGQGFPSGDSARFAVGVDRRKFGPLGRMPSSICRASMLGRIAS